MLSSIYISILDIILLDRGKKVRRKGTWESVNLPRRDRTYRPRLTSSPVPRMIPAQNAAIRREALPGPAIGEQQPGNLTAGSGFSAPWVKDGRRWLQPPCAEMGVQRRPRRCPALSSAGWPGGSGSIGAFHIGKKQ